MFGVGVILNFRNALNYVEDKYSKSFCGDDGLDVW